MSTIQLSVLMQLRRLGFGRNPLRRRVDRLESALLLGVLVAALLVIAAAAVLGTTIHSRAEHTEVLTLGDGPQGAR
ncbi:hypothetical protein EV643_11021 [Kribbella sp. VKM Ac-2527]|uniref:Uncharacterized protein n=1 Tax=Kribbella caucasensis TaxID=2512215 RepID=A0A4R6KB42_9ACTN|nr:hypothetical protein [Kribbella sp. VKM Ac-2527]TDO46638.1 hypothetical protein EV643_11021 [Kribbella sp. VKM Ac-2527]